MGLWVDVGCRVLLAANGKFLASYEYTYAAGSENTIMPDSILEGVNVSWLRGT